MLHSTVFSRLPTYIHSRNLIHRDVSPDNIIQHSVDKLPFLIDFGSVKQIAATAVFQFSGQAATAIGKQGYSPMEQMRHGKVSAASDLYALAVTPLVLLSGKKPQKFYDIHNRTWDWRSHVTVSPNLGTVLDKMLAEPPGDRYQSAKEVREALKDPKLSQIGNIISQIVTMNFVGRPFRNSTQTHIPHPQLAHRQIEEIKVNHPRSSVSKNTQKSMQRDHHPVMNP